MVEEKEPHCNCLKVIDYTLEEIDGYLDMHRVLVVSETIYHLTSSTHLPKSSTSSISSSIVTPTPVTPGK